MKSLKIIVLLTNLLRSHYPGLSRVDIIIAALEELLAHNLEATLIGGFIMFRRKKRESSFVSKHDAINLALKRYLNDRWPIENVLLCLYSDGRIDGRNEFKHRYSEQH